MQFCQPIQFKAKHPQLVHSQNLPRHPKDHEIITAPVLPARLRVLQRIRQSDCQRAGQPRGLSADLARDAPAGRAADVHHHTVQLSAEGTEGRQVRQRLARLAVQARRRPAQVNRAASRAFSDFSFSGSSRGLVLFYFISFCFN